MASYTTIIDHLLRMEGGKSADEAAARVRAALRLMPVGESLTDPVAVEAEVAAHLQGWATALAYEELRGWRWPFWLNYQMNPLAGNGGGGGAPMIPTLHNYAAREMMPVVSTDVQHYAGSIDRRGMVVPRDGRFAIEIWCRIGDDLIVPSAILGESLVEQGPGTMVTVSGKGGRLSISVEPGAHEEFQFLRVSARVTALAPGESATIYMAIRPYSLDGIVPVHDLVYNSKGFWMSDSRVVAVFTGRPEVSWASDARHGDAAQFLIAPPERMAVRCPAGMATAVSAFHLGGEGTETSADKSVDVLLPLTPVYPRELPMAAILPGSSGSRRSTVFPKKAPASLAGAGQKPLLHRDNALRAASRAQLLAATDVSAGGIGPKFLVHRNHWIVAGVRALLMEQELAAAGRLVSFCLLGMQRNGYLPQGRGKWGFQGQILVALADFYRLRNAAINETLTRYPQIRAMAKWIMRKRREISHAPKKPTGLLPPGVSRNGIGQDYFVADNIWAIEGLQAASWLARQFGEHGDADIFHGEAMKLSGHLKAAIHRELEYGIMQQVPGRLHRAFDAASAAELLDLALTEDARALLGPLDWFDGLVRSLAEPVSGNDAGGNDFRLLTMDERGVYPARRLLLMLLLAESDRADDKAALSDRIAEFNDLTRGLTTPLLVWPEMINVSKGLGCGKLPFDPEAAALYLILARKLNPVANNQAT